MAEESILRIDKFLWAVRMFKTRSQATDACRKGAVEIDEIKVKPSRTVHAGEIIQIRKNQVYHRIRVLERTGKRVSAKLVSEFIEDLTPAEEREKIEMRKAVNTGVRPRFPGRPTKRDRRLLDRYLENDE